MWVMIDTPTSNKHKKLLLGAVYLPPPVTLNLLDRYLINCNKVFEEIDTATYIIGDFNLSFIDWTFSDAAPKTLQTISSMEELLVDFIMLNELTQLNKVTNRNKNMLDLVLSNDSCCEVERATDVLSKIDTLHPPLLVNITSTLHKSLPYKQNIIRYNFYKADYISINKALSTVEWSACLKKLPNVNAMVDFLYDTIWKNIHEFTPIKKHKSSKYPCWFNKNLIRILKEKNNIRRRFIKYKNPLDKISLDILKKRCDRLAETCYKRYLVDTENNIASNPKAFWSLIKSKRSGKSSYPATMTYGADTANSGKDICNLFLSFFASVYNTDDNFDENTITNMLHSHNSTFAMLTISPEDIKKKIGSLDINKGPGSDDIPALFIKSCASSLVEPLHIIFNFSIESGTFPFKWKRAKVVPIFKGGELDSVKQYRPISLLCKFGKMLESLICPLIQSHCKQFTSNHQHGFFEARSTNTNLVTFESILSETIDSHGQADVIYTDFCKAFDRVSHKILVRKLECFGFAGPLLKWLESYLSNRSFYVVVNGYASE